MQAAAPSHHRVSLGALFLVFLQLGCTSFGGGTAGWIHRELVLRRGWIDDAEFLATLGLGQALPGANGIKTAALVGDLLHGALGALTAVLALLAGPFVIILAIGAAYSGFGDHPLMHRVLDGVAAAAIGLTFATGLRSGAQAAPGLLSLAILAGTVLCVGILRWPMLWVMLVLAPISIALALRRQQQP